MPQLQQCPRIAELNLERDAERAAAVRALAERDSESDAALAELSASRVLCFKPKNSAFYSFLGIASSGSADSKPDVDERRRGPPPLQRAAAASLLRDAPPMRGALFRPRTSARGCNCRARRRWTRTRTCTGRSSAYSPPPHRPRCASGARARLQTTSLRLRPSNPIFWGAGVRAPSDVRTAGRVGAWPLLVLQPRGVPLEAWVATRASAAAAVAAAVTGDGGGRASRRAPAAQPPTPLRTAFLMR